MEAAAAASRPPLLCLRGAGGCAGGVAGSELSGAPQALGKGAELGEMDRQNAPLCLSQGPFCEEALASAQPQRSRVNGARVASQPQRFPSRLARPSAPSAGVPAAFTFELNSAGVRCAPRIPGLCPRQQKTRQAGDPRSGGYPPPLDPGSGAQPGAQHCGTCGGRDLPPPGGRKTRGSPATQVRVRSPALPQAWLVQAGRLQTPGRAAALALRLGVPPATLVILPAPWPRHPTPGLGRGCCSTSLPPKETGGRAPWGSRGPELGPCTPCSSDPWPEPPPPAALPLRGPAPPTRALLPREPQQQQQFMSRGACSYFLAGSKQAGP